MTRLRFVRPGVRTLVFVAAIVSAAAVASASFASNIGGDGGGGYVGCQASGTTPSWSGINNVEMGGCPSFRTGFYAYKAGAGSNCWAIGYVARVYYVDPNNNWIQRWYGGAFCLDGIWHYSSASTYNERRVSTMQINSGGVDRRMIQYKLA